MQRTPRRSGWALGVETGCSAWNIGLRTTKRCGKGRILRISAGAVSNIDQSGGGAAEDVARATDAEPAVAVGFEEDEVAAGGVGLAVVAGDDVGEVEVEGLRWLALPCFGCAAGICGGAEAEV